MMNGKHVANDLVKQRHPDTLAVTWVPGPMAPNNPHPNPSKMLQYRWDGFKWHPTGAQRFVKWLAGDQAWGEQTPPEVDHSG